MSTFYFIVKIFLFLNLFYITKYLKTFIKYFKMLMYKNFNYELLF